MSNFILPFRPPSSCPVYGHTDTMGFHYCSPTTCQARSTRSRSVVALNNSSNDTVKCSKSEDCVYLPETLSFLAVEFSSIASYRGSQSSWHRQPKLESSLAAGTWYNWNLLRRRRVGSGHGSPLFPVCPSRSSYQNKTKRKTQKRKGTKQRPARKASRKEQRESQTLLYLAYTSTAVVTRASPYPLLQIK